MRRRTSVRSLTGAPGSGSRWTKDEDMAASAQAGSSNRPSIRGRPSATRTATIEGTAPVSTVSAATPSVGCAPAATGALPIRINAARRAMRPALIKTITSRSGAAGERECALGPPLATGGLLDAPGTIHLPHGGVNADGTGLVAPLGGR